MSRWLSREDVAELTARVKFKAQAKVLDELGIPFRPGAGGRPLVKPEDVDGKAPKARNRGPKWDRMAA